MAVESVFTCQKCGQCCEGKGGIILSSSDLSRLAEFLGQSAEHVIAAYGESRNGKLHLKTGENGYCIFFQPNIGCSIHEGKPDICRAWPWFRGNMEDKASFLMARDYCPGISREAEHFQFIEEGRHYLAENNLIAKTGEICANSLLQAEQN